MSSLRKANFSTGLTPKKRGSWSGWPRLGALKEVVVTGRVRWVVGGLGLFLASGVLGVALYSLVVSPSPADASGNSANETPTPIPTPTITEFSTEQVVDPPETVVVDVTEPAAPAAPAPAPAPAAAQQRAAAPAPAAAAAQAPAPAPAPAPAGGDDHYEADDYDDDDHEEHDDGYEEPDDHEEHDDDAHD